MQATIRKKQEQFSFYFPSGFVILWISHPLYFSSPAGKRKILLRRTVRLTKLSQGKQGIADHIRHGLFMVLNTDALHFQTGRRDR